LLIVFKTEGYSDYVWSVAISPGGDYIASGSSDRTVRIWEVETGEEINCRFAGKDGWMMNTPDAYFYCSDGGIRHVSFVDGLVVYPGTDFEKEFRRPDVIRERLAKVMGKR